MSRNRPYYSLNNEQLRIRVEIISNAPRRDAEDRPAGFFIAFRKRVSPIPLVRGPSPLHVTPAKGPG